MLWSEALGLRRALCEDAAVGKPSPRLLPIPLESSLVTFLFARFLVSDHVWSLPCLRMQNNTCCYSNASESTEGFNLPFPRQQPPPSARVYLPKAMLSRPLAKALGISLYWPVFSGLASQCYEHLFVHAQVSKGDSGELGRSYGPSQPA